MLALIAAIIFGLVTFGVHLGSLNLLALGFCFLAAHFVVPVSPLVPRFNRNQ